MLISPISNVKANLKSRKTVAKYEELGQLPGQLKQPRTHRTRPDAFAGDWAMIEEKLDIAPELEAKAWFEGLLIHSVLPYSNWEWGRLAQSASLMAMQLGLQSSLFKLGYGPRYHQTDNSSAATCRLGIYQEAGEGQERCPATSSGRCFTEGYLHLLDHFGLEPRVIHVGNPNENGDIESANGNLKRALE